MRTFKVREIFFNVMNYKYPIRQTCDLYFVVVKYLWCQLRSICGRYEVYIDMLLATYLFDVQKMTLKFGLTDRALKLIRVMSIEFSRLIRKQH